MAKEIEGITIKFGANTAEYDSSIHGINQGLKTLKSEFKALNKDLKINPKNLDSLKEKLSNLEQQLTLVKKRNEQYAESLKELGTRTDANAKQFDDLTRKLIDGESSVRAITHQIERLKGTIDSLNVSKLEMLQMSLKKTGDNLQQMGKLLAPLSMLGGGLIGKATKDAINFETAFAGVAKTVDATEPQLEKLKEGIVDLSTKLPSSTEEISAVAEAAGQLGIKTSDILDFTETMIGLGSATNLTADEASTMIAQFANVTGMTGDYDKLGSALVALGNNGSSTEKDIMELAQRLSGAGTTAGLTEQEILGLGASMANVGINAEAGGTSMSTWISDISMAVAKGGENLQGFLEVSQMTSKEFTELWNTDPTKVLQELLNGLNRIDDEGGSSLMALSKIGIEGTRSRDMILRLANAENSIANAVELSNQAWDENIALQTEVDKKNETMGAQLDITKNLLTDISRVIGEQFAPTLAKFNDFMRNAYEAFKKLTPEQKKLIAKMVTMATALSPVLIGLGTLSSHLGDVVGKFPKLKGQIGDVSKIFTPFVNVFNMFSNLLAPVISKLGFMGKLFEPIKGALTIMSAKFASLAMWLNPFKELLVGLTTKFSAFGGAIGKVLTQIMPLGGWIGAIVVALGYAIATNENVRNSIMQIFNSLQQALMPIMNALTVLLNTVVKPAFDALINVLNWLSINVIQPLFAFISTNLAPLFVKVADIVGTVLTLAFKTLGGVVETIIGFFDGLFTIIGKCWEQMSQLEWVQGLIQFFTDLWGIVDNLIDAFGRLVDAIGNAWNKAMDFMSNIGKNIGDAIGGIFSSGGLGVNAELMASGGLGIRNLTVNAPINVNNHGQQITANEVNGWIEQIADGVSVVLGRRLIDA